MKDNKPSPMVSDLQKRLKATKATQLQIVNDTGVAQSIVSRTMNGRMPSLVNYEALLAYVENHERKAKRKVVRK